MLLTERKIINNNLILLLATVPQHAKTTLRKTAAVEP